MHPHAALATLLVLATVSPSFAQPIQEPSPRESREIGRFLARRDCAACHAVGARGRSPNPSAPPFRYLYRRIDVDSLGEGLASGVLTNHPKMPVFHYAPREVVGVVRYLKSVQHHRPEGRDR